MKAPRSNVPVEVTAKQARASDPEISAFVAANAGANLIPHARQGAIKWRCAGMFAAAGVAGAYAGSTLGKAFDGQKLLFLFALLMIVVGALMLKTRGDPGDPDVQCRRENAPKVLGIGGATGLFSGFFGIGGGFLIVPGLMASTGMPMRNAVGSSLVAVAASRESATRIGAPSAESRVKSCKPDSIFGACGKIRISSSEVIDLR